LKYGCYVEKFLPKHWRHLERNALSPMRQTFGPSQLLVSFYFFNYLGIIGSINTALQDAPIAKEFNTTKLAFFKINSSKTCYKQISLDNHLQHTAPIDTKKKYSKLY